MSCDIENALILLVFQNIIDDESDNDFENDSDFESIAEDNDLITLFLLQLSEKRYHNPRIYNISKLFYWYNKILPFYDDKRFKKILRMTSESFKKLVQLISSHNIFKSNSQRKQAPVELQLAIFLHRIESRSDIFNICSKFDIGEETVILYTKRIIKAIIAQKNLFVQWPKGEKRNHVHRGFQLMGGFENVIGAVDGTHIILNEKPSNSPELYFNRKKCYSIHCQGIVDFQGIFINYDIRWPGSVHDAKVYKNSNFYKKKDELIIDDDFLLGDSAYPISPFCITPFCLSSNLQEKKFNIMHSLHRVVVENAFGLLKSRFTCLKGYSVKKIKHLIFFTDCAIILHNFLELNGERWELSLDDKEKEDNIIDKSNNDSDNILKLEDQQKRNNIMRKYVL